MAPIFIVGCPRSGTTLLRNLLRSHPRLSFPKETHFIPQLYTAYGDPRNQREARRLVKLILQLPRVGHWGCRFDEPALMACRSYAGLIDQLFRTFARAEGKQRWGDKTPQNVLHIPTLAAIFPRAKFIHIYRDGRDVARSRIAAPHGPENWFTAAAEWRKLVGAGRQAGAGLPGGMYMELRYEALLADLECTLRRVCEFIEEPFDRAVLVQNVLPVPAPRFRPFSRGYNNQPMIVTDNANKWRSNVTLEQRTLFESVAGALLEELGYETEGLGKDIPGYARWAWKADSFVRETVVRLKTATWAHLSRTAIQKSRTAIRGGLRRVSA